MHVLDMRRLAVAVAPVGAELAGKRHRGADEGAEIAAVTNFRKNKRESLLKQQTSDGDRQQRSHKSLNFLPILPHNQIRVHTNLFVNQA